MKKFTLCLTASAVLLMLTATRAQAVPIVIDGITFPDGAASFADVVVSYTPGPDANPPHNNPSDALGLPNYNGSSGYTSLGELGTLILRFTDNALTTSGDATADLHIFEVGAAVESFNTAISTDGIVWIDLGTLSGQPTSIDIDAKLGVVLGALYRYVRITDVLPSQSGAPFGEADIDAVGAISSVQIVPEPATLAFLSVGLLGTAAMRRRARRKLTI